MNVKIFSIIDSSVEPMENEINEFIQGKKVINITQSESRDSESLNWSLTITVLYE